MMSTFYSASEASDLQIARSRPLISNQIRDSDGEIIFFCSLEGELENAPMFVHMSFFAKAVNDRTVKRLIKFY